MNSASSSTVNIRLDIQIPTGAGPVAVGQPGTVRALLGEGDGVIRFFRSTNPNGVRWPVMPVAGTSLGVICATVVYDSPKQDVKAFVYPDAHYPPSPSSAYPVASDAVSGMGSSNNTVWTWTYPAPLVKGADHFASTTSGASNRLGIWFQNNPSGAYYFDDSPRFYGYTDARPCGSGSGSGMLMGGSMEELSAADMLLISVPGGPFEGRHPAERHSPRAWIAEVGKERWEISVGPEGRLIIRTRSKTVESKRVDSSPFMAVFPGEAFETKDEVVVTAR